MSVHVILQPFAGAHRELFWETLRRCGLHPLPLSEAWEVCLDESEIQELMVNFVDFDIVDAKGMAGKPFLAIELDIDAFDGETKHLRGRAAIELLKRHRNSLVAGNLLVDELYTDVKLITELRRKKRHRIAWLSDGCFWATDSQEEGLIEIRFKRAMSKAA